MLSLVSVANPTRTGINMINCVSTAQHKSTRYLTPDLKKALNNKEMYSHWQQNDLVTAPVPQEILSLPTGRSAWKSHSEP